uniref:Schlafen AlbA-2 domain-containing protein n=1 Tax=Chromera velia CCMP2878 TaxID=1169474 RepID=A0A0G4FAY4_9ALVE|eukprot:Cvel_3006.t1-p1 / transcript=Cvel_3006.t1 / gene=Cvel_3006 / organism=Chromera_velia_CCMP2878 / gene_product=hypothetical protein / transcript_product=hypothetical protein / location=Cvel_scaffold120:620-1897(-) / protein_length=426 / sequence_SO=supercontig / SO=protein_coding / is_pseudo=false
MSRPQPYAPVHPRDVTEKYNALVQSMSPESPPNVTFEQNEESLWVCTLTVPGNDSTFKSKPLVKKVEAGAHAKALWYNSKVSCQDYRIPLIENPERPVQAAKTPKLSLNDYCTKMQLRAKYSTVRKEDGCCTTVTLLSPNGSYVDSAETDAARAYANFESATFHPKYAEHKAAARMLCKLAKTDTKARDLYKAMYPVRYRQGGVFLRREGIDLELKGGKDSDSPMPLRSFRNYLGPGGDLVNYITAFLNSKVDGQIVFGVHDRGIIQGIPIAGGAFDQINKNEWDLLKRVVPPISHGREYHRDVIKIDHAFSDDNAQSGAAVIVPTLRPENLRCDSDTKSYVLALEKENKNLRAALSRLKKEVDVHEVHDDLYIFIYHVQGADVSGGRGPHKIPGREYHYIKTVGGINKRDDSKDHNRCWSACNCM